MIKKLALQTFLAVLLASPAFSNIQSKNPSIGMQLFETVPDARAAAMGGSNSAIGDDVNSMYTNPAGLAYVNHLEMPFSKNDLGGGDLVQQHYGACYAMRDVRISNIDNPGALALSWNKIESDTLGYLGQVMMVSYGKVVYQDTRAGAFSMGLNAKMLEEQVSGVTAKGTAYDAGLRWKYPRKNIFASYVLRNIGPKFNDTTDLPGNSVVGFGAKMFDERIAANVDFNTPALGSNYYNIGAEWMAFQMIALRAGYNSGMDAGKGVSAGAGLMLKQIDFLFNYIYEVDLDYSYMPYADGKGNQRLSLVIKFGAD
jgi:hypothetical protein